jgi:hypothetical protein
MDTQMQKEIRKAGTEAIDTDMFERMKEEGILHSPDEPAELVLFLASKAADGITGEHLSFDDREIKLLISQNAHTTHVGAPVRDFQLRHFDPVQPVKAITSMISSLLR